MTESVTVKVSKDLQNLASRCELCPELIQEINDFCWLWPAFELGGSRSNNNLQAINMVEKKAIDFFSKRYLTSDNADARLNELTRTNAEKNCIKKLSLDSSTDKQKALLCVVKRVRNNLFHGNKANAGIKPDELDLFKHANSLLRIWIGIPVPSE